MYECHGTAIFLASASGNSSALEYLLTAWAPRLRESYPADELTAVCITHPFAPND